ncbi:MAG: hypothetical protein IJW60_04655 [Clostridia bacterium]|nr:hypothetical protein [Clostridia bacterium]
MELYTTDLHFIGESEQDTLFDFCVHGKVFLKIGDEILSDGQTEWCVSASAYHFLRTLFQDRLLDTENQMIPCCGHFLMPSEDKTTVTIIGCPNGIDFSVSRENEYIVIRTRDHKTFNIPFEEYANAVLTYARQIDDFYKQNPPRRFQDKFEKDGFCAFCNEWYVLMKKAQALLNDDSNIEKIIFDEKIDTKNIKKRRKNENETRKASFINALKELGASLILALLAVIATLVGAGLLCFFPFNCIDGLPDEFILFLGFFALFAILYVIAAIVYIIQKIKAKSAKKKNSNDTENSAQK